MGSGKVNTTVKVKTSSPSGCWFLELKPVSNPVVKLTWNVKVASVVEPVCVKCEVESTNEVVECRQPRFAQIQGGPSTNQVKQWSTIITHCVDA